MTYCCVDQFANIGKCGSSGVDITLCYQTMGDKSKPCLLLLSEMGMSGIALWHDSFVKELASLHAFYIVVFDYRDCGKSTHISKRFDTHNKNINSIGNINNNRNISSNKKECEVSVEEFSNKNSGTPPLSILQKGECRLSDNTFAKHTAHRNFVKSIKEIKNCVNELNVSCSSFSGCSEEKCDDNDHDGDNIIDELFESTEGTKTSKRVNCENKVKMSSSQLKTNTRVMETNSSLPPSPSTLSIYVQLLRAFHTPGKYLVKCPYNLSDIAHDAWELLLTHLSLKEVHLVGFSFGGMVAQMMTLQHPDKVKSLTLLATHSSNLNKTQWPSYMEILRYVRLLPSSLEPLIPSSVSESSSQSKQQSLHSMSLHDDNTNNVNIAEATLLAHPHETEHKEKLLDLYTCTLTKFMEMICGDKERFPFDKTWTERLMRQTCERGIDIDGAFNHIAVLLNASGRDALLHSIFTSNNTNQTSLTFINDKTENTNELSPTAANVNAASFQHASSSHFTHIHSIRKINNNNTITRGRRYYIPTVIIQGTHDKLTPLCNAQHLASVIDGSKLIVINGMGHTLLPALDRQLANIIAENVELGNATWTNMKQQQEPTVQLPTSHL